MHKIAKQIGRLKKMLRLIKKQKTGTPKEFAHTLRVSRRQMYRDIQQLKELGAPITYNKNVESFCYKKENFSIELDFSLRFLSDDEEKMPECFFMLLKPFKFDRTIS